MQERLFYISELIGKELNGTITVVEATVLNEWVNSSAANKKLFDQLHNDGFVKQQLERFDSYNTEKYRAYLMGKLEERANSERAMVNHSTVAHGESPKTKNIKLWKRLAVAASIVGLLFVGYWLMKDKTTDDGPQTKVVKTNDVQAPDKNRAQITLADGSTVYLDRVANGQLASMNGVIVKKTDDGKIVYEAESGSSTPITIYNTLTNPRGSKVIDITLADGSRVWLNAGSSLAYPMQFASKERNVSISGEAYFEVAPDKTKPFKVSKGDMTVEVLGTHFNVHAYDNEREVKVTLLEGSVKVSRQLSVGVRESKTIKPGEQSVSTGNGKLAIKKDVDVEKVMGWKNNEFIFNDDDLNNIMSQISYWYDIDVEFNGRSATNYSGRISRNASVSKVLNMFEKLGYVKFEINGKKVTVINLK